MKQKGLLIVISGFSGAGKGTLVKALPFEYVNTGTIINGIPYKCIKVVYKNSNNIEIPIYSETKYDYYEQDIGFTSITFLLIIVFCHQCQN